MRTRRSIADARLLCRIVADVENGTAGLRNAWRNRGAFGDVPGAESGEH